MENRILANRNKADIEKHKDKFGENTSYFSLYTKPGNMTNSMVLKPQDDKDSTEAFYKVTDVVIFLIFSHFLSMPSKRIILTLRSRRIEHGPFIRLVKDPLQKRFLLLHKQRNLTFSQF
jgi:hypothetical protein